MSNIDLLINTPLALQNRQQWILWKLQTKPGADKPTKLPISPQTGNLCSVTDASHWASFNDALSAWERYPHCRGVGFCLEAGLVVVDLDHALDAQGEPLPWAESILALMPPTFVEVSQSGTGLHVYLQGQLQGRRNRWRLASGNQIELYETARFLAYTGNRFRNAPLIVDQGEHALNALYEQFGPPAEPLPSPPSVVSLPSLPLTDTTLIEKMLAPGQSDKIRRLWAGDVSDYGGDESAADMALLCALAWWCNHDKAQIERLFDQSALGQRDKWRRRADYRERSIQNACQQVRGGYTGNQTELVSVMAGAAPPCGFMDEWLQPVALPTALPPVEPFEFALLPHLARDWAEDVAHRIQCPPDYVGVGMMVALSAVVGRRVTIRPKRNDPWAVVPNLWAMAVGRPSMKKTPALSAILKPLELLEVQAAKQYQAKLQDHETVLAAHKMQQSATETKVKRQLISNNPPSSLSAIADSLRGGDDLPDAPKRIRYLVNDTSIEKLGELMADNPNGLLYYRDELGGFLHLLEKEGHAADRKFY